MTLQSPCCGAAVRVLAEWSYDDNRMRSQWHVCTACGQPCDPVPSTPGVNRGGKENEI